MSKSTDNGHGLGGMEKRGSVTHISLVAILALFSLPVSADEYHYNNILLGDRAAGMGGAYTAISDDPSGLFYNPAGIIYAQGTNVSVSANAYHQSKTNYNNVIGGNGWNRTSSALLPNFFGVIQPLGKGKVGFSYAVPDSIIEDQDQAFTNIPLITKYVVNFNKNDNTYCFGPSYAVELSRGVSVGGTLYVQYRSSQWILNQLINLNTGQYEWTNRYYQTSEWGLRPVVGLMWNTTEKLSIGLTASLTKVLNSTTTDQTIFKDILYDGNTVSRTSIQSTEKRQLPFTTTLGFAYFPSNKLVVSGDISFYGSSKGFESDPGDDRVATTNIALGTEYYLDEKWAVRAGLFTDKANTPKINSGDSNALDHVDLTGFTLSACYFTRQSAITLGTAYRSGSGKAQILGGTAIQDVKMTAWTFTLSASYFY